MNVERLSNDLPTTVSKSYRIFLGTGFESIYLGKELKTRFCGMGGNKETFGSDNPQAFRCKKYTNTSTLTCRLPDVSPWIERDIAKHDRCGDEPLSVADLPPSEPRIMEQATKHAEDDDITGDLPDLVCSFELLHATKTIRDELESPDSARNIRAVVFLRPGPITSLQGKDFVLAWVDCVKCMFVFFLYVGCNVSY